MAGQSDRETLKRNAIQMLDESRTQLGGGLTHFRKEWNPRTLVQHSVAKHRWAIIGGAAVAGFLATRVFFSRTPKISRDTSAQTARKRGLIGILLATLWRFGREPLLGLATQKLMPVAMQYINNRQQSFQNPSTHEHTPR